MKRAKVIGLESFRLYSSMYFYIQTSMSVLNTVQAVISCVLTQLVVEAVHVTLVTSSAVITGHVLVCNN